MSDPRSNTAGWNIHDQNVREAMAKVRRRDFLDETFHPFSDDDRPLDIGYGQTNSAPSVVAFMTEQLQLGRSDRVLEVGTGSGYQAAILATLADEVYTIEIIAPLYLQAAAKLPRLGFSNVKARHGEGQKGWPEAAPFDRIIVTCAPVEIPKVLIDQLRDGGRMVIPVGPIGGQNIHIIQKQQGQVLVSAVLPVRFVPMLGFPTWHG